jgi:ATP-dependent DNA helicase DinG
MIAAVARALVKDQGVLAVEAPTGTGKSIAYLLGAVPVALARKKTLLIATATVALQEQLVERDLPAFLQATGLQASVALAKGRQRYACTRNLHELTRKDSEIPQGGFEFGASTADAAWPRAPREGESERFATLLGSLMKGAWDGDLDRSPLAIDDESKRLITTSAGGCSNRRCPWITACPFVQARNRLQGAQIVVANHDLVLADLELGKDEDGSGGILLPTPRDTLYVFDEAHHLPAKAIDRGSAEVSVADARRRLQRLANPLRAAFVAANRDRIGRLDAAQVDALLDRLIESLDALNLELENAWPQQDADPEMHWRAQLGQLPEQWCLLSQELCHTTAELVRWIPAALKAIVESDLPSDRREGLARELGLARERLEAQAGLWWLWAQQESETALPRARWLSRTPDGGLVCSASEVSAAPTLRRVLWPQAAGVVLASATLSIGGDFRSYAAQIGLPENAETLALPSPFDLRAQARLEVPALRNAPEQRDAHVAEVVKWLSEQLDWAQGNLVLFTSKAKLEACLSALPAERRLRILAQGSRSKAELLKSHAAAVQAGAGSTLFGLASFGEGLDLPGRLCETVVITQLPFAVPTDPVGATYAEWLEARGRNAFVEVTIPQATRTLIQYCGRLIRGENDSGRIVILDNRLLTRRYGARMLSALPDFDRLLGAIPTSGKHG